MIKKLFEKKWKRGTAISLSSILLLCAAGAVWNAAAINVDMNSYPPMGQMVSVFDTEMHVFSAGEEGATLVLLSGWGTTAPSIDFYPIWSRLQSCARVVVLERPGYGWSDPTSRDRTVQNMVEEDHAALAQAGFPPPYYLAAHSMGGLEAALFAASYPDEVSGVFLIDSMAPDITIAEGAGSISTMDTLVPIFKAIGLLRLVNAISPSVIDSQYAKQNDYNYVDASLLPAERALTLKNAQSEMMREEWDLYIDNALYVKERGFPSSIPLVAVISDKDEANPRYAEMLSAQQAWVEQSEYGELITLHGGHYLHHYAPDALCALIRERLHE